MKIYSDMALWALSASRLVYHLPTAAMQHQSLVVMEYSISETKIQAVYSATPAYAQYLMMVVLVMMNNNLTAAGMRSHLVQPRNEHECWLQYI